jgi:hypothetical protein
MTLIFPDVLKVSDHVAVNLTAVMLFSRTLLLFPLCSRDRTEDAGRCCMCKLMRFSYLSRIVFFANGSHPVVLAISAAPHHSHNCPQSPQQQFESNMTISAGITWWVLLRGCQTVTKHWSWTAMTYSLTSSTQIVRPSPWLWIAQIMNCYNLPTDFISSNTDHELPWLTHWLHELPHRLWTAMTYPLTSSASHRGCRYIIIWTKLQVNHLQSLHPESLSHFQSNRKESNVPCLGAYRSMWSMSFWGKNRTVHKFVSVILCFTWVVRSCPRLRMRRSNEKIHCKFFYGSLCCCMIYVNIIYIRTFNKAFLLAWVILVGQDQFWVGTWFDKWELSALVPVSKIWIETRSDFWELGLVFGTRFGTGTKFSLF